MRTFKLEEYLTQYEFSNPYMLCCSDVESWHIADLLALADDKMRSKWQQLSLAYTEPYGEPTLRNQIAKSLYPGLSESNILCFAGAEEGIYACLNVLCDARSHAIVVTPCYQSLYEIPAKNCQSVTAISLLPQEQWQLDLNQVAAAIQPNTRCIVINYPHNPTGQLLDQQTLNHLIDLCRQHGIWLFCDEVYHLLGEPGMVWPQPVATQYEKAISLGVMSKAFGMPGLRIGWVACQDNQMLLKFKQYKDYLSICNSAPSELLAQIALLNHQQILEKNNALVTTNLEKLKLFLEKFSELFSWIPPQGGCIGLIKYHGVEKVDDLCHQLVSETGVLLMPGSIYGLDGNYFRVGFGRKNFSIALAKFEEFLDL